MDFNRRSNRARTRLLGSNELPVFRANGAAKIKEQLIRAVGGSFWPMGYDFSAMNLEPVAGAIREIQVRKIIVAIYQGQGGTALYDRKHTPRMLGPTFL